MSSSVSQNASRRATISLIAANIDWLIIAFGAALRAAEYFANSAFYVDEGALALNVLNRPLATLFRPLDSNQAAPLGFVLIEKVIVTVFGESELAFRLFPFLSSIIALFLFRFVARRILNEWFARASLLFFAVSGQVIYYSAQAKQYSSDIAIGLAITLVALNLVSLDLTMKRVALLALFGSIVVWISHPSVFVLGGCGLALAIREFREKHWSVLRTYLLCFGVWVASFLVFYTVSLNSLGGNQRLEASWMKKGTFMPLLPTSFAELKWFPDLIRIFSNPLASPLPLTAAALFVCGAIVLFRKNFTHWAVIMLPFLLTLIASGIHKYPFGRRLLLFLVPAMIFAIISAVDDIATRRQVATGVLIGLLALFEIVAGGIVIPSRSRLIVFSFVSVAILVIVLLMRSSLRVRFVPTFAAGFLLLVLLVRPVGGAARKVLRSEPNEDIRPILTRMMMSKDSGDLIYVYYHQKESFQYYARRLGIDSAKCILGVDEREHWINAENLAYEKDLDELRGKGRVWFLFSFVRTINGINEEQYFTHHLDQIGTRLYEQHDRGASGYLYDLSSRTRGAE